MEEEEDGHSNTRDYGIHNLFHLLREVVCAILKCLGFDGPKPPNSDENPSYAFPDPPSTRAQDPSPTNDPPPTEDLGTRTRRPTRPGVGSGRDPQTNSVQPS